MSSKKVRIVWKDGLNSKGEPIKYQSLEEFTPVESITIQETKCYHDWEAYEGLWFSDKKCLKCGKVENL